MLVPKATTAFRCVILAAVLFNVKPGYQENDKTLNLAVEALGVGPHHLDSLPGCLEHHHGNDTRKLHRHTVDKYAQRHILETTLSSSSQPLHHSGFPPLLIAKRLWASGFNARHVAVPQRQADSPWLTWNTTKAEAIFRRHWERIQFLGRSCAERFQKGFMFGCTPHWGIGSGLRDVQDQLLFGFLEGRVVIFQPHREKPYSFGICAGIDLWMEGCFFQSTTGCASEFELWWNTPRLLDFSWWWRTTPQSSCLVPQITDSAWFLKKSQPLWDELRRADAVRWLRALGDEATEEVSEQHVSHELQHMGRLAMLRALMLRVAFGLTASLQNAVEAVRARADITTAGSGPRVAIHIRRTDKPKDFFKPLRDITGLQPSEREPTDGLENVHIETYELNPLAHDYVPRTLSTISTLLLPWFQQTVGTPAEIFAISDDDRLLGSAAGQVLLGRLQPTETARIVLHFDNASARLRPQELTLSIAGHLAWGNRAENAMQALAECWAAGSWADYVIGSGTSGMTQLIAELIGGRLGIDPNVISLWEDDRVGVAAASSSLRSQKRFSNGSSLKDNG